MTRVKQATPYVLGGSAPVLRQFSKMASMVPISFADSVVKLALDILEAVQTIADNKKTCQALVTHLGQLMIVVMKPWVRGSDDDIAAELQDNRKEVERRLGCILDKLEDLRGARWWGAQVIKSRERTEKLKECQVIMDQAMAFFQVETMISAAMQLETPSFVPPPQDTPKFLPQAFPFPSEPSVQYPSVPPKPEVLFGREAEVEHFAACFGAMASPRLAILGPGGIGKTSVALAVVADPRVRAKYGEYIHWVPGAEATSAELFFELVARSMGVPKGEGGDRKLDILRFLRSSTEPRILLLDNFETPWDVVGQQFDIDDFLRDLSSVPHLSLLLTMRADQPPSTHIRWTDSSLLPVLSPESARQLYLDIHEDAESDPALETLLREMTYMPLALKLLATRGRGGEMPTALLELWERLRTKVSDQGDDRFTSIKLAIGMSISSNLMRADADALILLSILAELPGGARPDFLPSIAPSIRNIGHTLNTLQQAALTFQAPSSGLVHLLPPVRSFILHERPASAFRRNSIQQAYYKLLRKYDAEPGDNIFAESVRVLTMETVNLENLLLGALDNSPAKDGIRAAYAYAHFQYWTAPRVDIIAKAVGAARENHSPKLLAEGLSGLAMLLSAVRRYDQAVDVEKEALGIHRGVGDKRKAAFSLTSLGRLYRALNRYDDAISSAKKALATYRAIGDEYGTATSLDTLGSTYRTLNRFGDALTAGEEALALYRVMEDQLGAANSLYNLGRAYRMVGRYDDALKAGKEALDLYRAIGDQKGAANALYNLGRAYRMVGRSDCTLTAEMEALVIYHTIGDQKGAANALDSLGRGYRKLGRYDDAVAAVNEALGIYRAIGNQVGAANSLHNVSQVYRMAGRYEETVKAEKEALEIYRAIGNQGEVANVLNDLGSAYGQMGRFNDAVAVAREAVDIHRASKNLAGTASSLRALGRFHWSSGRKEDAVRATKEALGIYRRLESKRPAVQACLVDLAEFGGQTT